MDLEGVGRGREKGPHIQAAHPGSRHLAKGGWGWLGKEGGANINHKDWWAGNAPCLSREVRLSSCCKDSDASGLYNNICSVWISAKVGKLSFPEAEAAEQ